MNALIQPTGDPAFLAKPHVAPVACDGLTRSPIGFRRRIDPCELAAPIHSTRT